MRKFSDNPNIDNSDLSNYPDGRTKDNTGTGDGTPVNERVYGDVSQFFLKLIRLAGITPNNLPDNETNGYQTIQALKEFATKNNYIQNISSVSGVLNVSAKIGLMQNDEFLVCKASVDLGAETQIKGTDGTTIAISAIGAFKTNEYVRLIKTASVVVLIRIADDVSLDAMISDLLYLKKASQAQENAGTSDLVATTPLVNKVTFTRRVNGADSTPYLASASQNGLMSIAQFNQLAALVNPIINRGYVSGINVATSSGSMVVSGDISSAVATSLSDSTKLVITMANAMASPNYLVKMFLQSQSSNITSDDNVLPPVFKIISTTQFEIGMSEMGSDSQNLKIHIEVEQL